MAYDFVDGIPLIFGASADELFTQETARLMLRATQASLQFDRLQTLQTRWAPMENKRRCGVNTFNNAPLWEAQLTEAAGVLLREIGSIEKALEGALTSENQQSRLYQYKVSPNAWDSAFTRPLEQIRNKLFDYHSVPGQWQKDANFMPPLMVNDQSLYYEYKRSFEADLQDFERALPKESAHLRALQLRSAGQGHSRDR